MDWRDIAGAVGKAAPIVGTLLGGPAGAAVGGLISMALGTDNNPDAVSAALAGNPDALVKIKELEVNAQVQLQQLAVQAEQNRLVDVQSARARQTANPKDYTPQVLAYLVTVGFFGTLAALAFAKLDPATQNTLLVMVGTLSTAWVAIVGFYFGSSKDSAAKTQMLADVGYAAASAPVNVTTHAAPVQTVAQPVARNAPPFDPNIYKGS